ncbi:MAG: hypothetical protein HN904_00410, partial [Victivallales bacterium]|nr:hypothetical protein [Victivallales bacterium]
LPKELPGPVYVAAVAVGELAFVRVLLSWGAFLFTSVLLLIGVVVTFRSVFVVHAPEADPPATAQESQPED